jgi:DNA-directed RNA polymerase subunit RPC12/RpoP
VPGLWDPSVGTDEITFIVEYQCPACGAALEARSSETYGWLRCPRCGRASLPPEHMQAPRPRRREPLGDDVLVIGPDHSQTAAGRSAFRPGSVRRIAASTALFLSLFIALLAWLEQGRAVAWLFSVIALACLVCVLFPSRRPSRVL